MILKFSKTILLLFVALVLIAAEVEKQIIKFDSTASFYHQKFQGRRTANGEKFDQNKLTAANNKLPLGTEVKVTRIKDKDTFSVEVIINDRTHKKYSERIDLSRAAAKKLHLLADGVAPVTIEVL